jgi:serine-type D-Ala-D-Ala carboxypeptidase (penicillin-binding protein 5/6)
MLSGEVSRRRPDGGKMSNVANRFAQVALVGALLVGALTATGGAAQAGNMDTIARQAVLIDMTTQTVLFEKNADERMPPSSMSKIMTAYMVFSALKEGRVKLEDGMPVSQRAWKMGGSKMYVELDNSVKIDDLIKGVIVQSGNDACIVLAEGLAGSEEEFARRATAKAKELGLTGTNLVNATGWPDPQHYMTARDLAKLAQRLITDFPEYYHYYSIREFTYHKIKQGNRNPLLYRNIGADGLKTGHTDAAGYGLTASAERDGRRLVLVVNGLPNMQARADESARLIEWGFREFQNYALFKRGDVVDEARVWLGQAPTVPVTVAKDLKVTMTPSERDGMKVTLVTPTAVAAPIKAGDPVGKLVITGPGFSAKEVPVVAAADVERKGVFGRAVAAARYFVFGS